MAPAWRFSTSPTTVQKRRKPTSVADRPTGPVEPHSTVLRIEEEAMIVAFRRPALLPLDDCLSTLQSTIPGLTRSCLHRSLLCHSAKPRQVQTARLRVNRFCMIGNAYHDAG